MASFNQHFNILDTRDNVYKSKKETYKYFNTFNEPYNYSDIYRFSKEYINQLTSIYSNTCKTIFIFATQSDGFKHKIFYLSTDELDNTIKKEKFSEDLDIIPPFDIYVQLEIIEIPIRFTLNSPTKVLRPTFKIKREYSPRTHDGSIEKRLYFYTKRIESGQETKEEIYNLCQAYLTNFQTLYKKETVNDINRVTKSCYEISLLTGRDCESIYYCEIDSDGDYLEESHIYENLTPIIRKPYKIQLLVYLIYDPHQQPEMEYDTQSEIEELELRLNNLKTNLEAYQNKTKMINKRTKEETCCICLISPTNILFTDCGHQCICDKCNDKLLELKCPFCRTSITQPRILL